MKIAVFFLNPMIKKMRIQMEYCNALELMTYFHITISVSICKALFRAQMVLGVWMGFLDPGHALPPWFILHPHVLSCPALGGGSLSYFPRGVL